MESSAASEATVSEPGPAHGTAYPTVPAASGGPAPENPAPWQDYQTVFTNAKAGMDGVDKEHVQRVVYEMSKDSAHFRNEQRKQVQLEARVERLKAAAAATTAAELSAGTRSVDQQVASLESRRDLTRTWLHADMDCFYAAVHEAERPELKRVPMAVGGMGMISTANYVARKYGVRSAMPGFIAKRLCPQLVFVQPDFPRYIAAAERVRLVFQQLDPDFETGGLDEAYLDVTDYCARTGSSGGEAAAELRRRVRESCGGLTCSCGVAPNKMLAKICSDINKPDGHYVLPASRTAVMSFMDTLPVRKIPCIGKVTEQLLRGVLGVSTCGQLLGPQRGRLPLLFSETAAGFFLEAALGLAPTRHPPKTDTSLEPGRKGISCERTFRNMGAPAQQEAMARQLVESLAADMAAEGLEGRNLTLKLKLSTFEVRSRAATLPRHVRTAADMLPTVLRLLRAEMPVELRLMGVRMAALRKMNSAASSPLARLLGLQPQRPGSIPPPGSAAAGAAGGSTTLQGGFGAAAAVCASASAAEAGSVAAPGRNAASGPGAAAAARTTEPGGSPSAPRGRLGAGGRGGGGAEAQGLPDGAVNTTTTTITIDTDDDDDDADHVLVGAIGNRRPPSSPPPPQRLWAAAAPAGRPPVVSPEVSPAGRPPEVSREAVTPRRAAGCGWGAAIRCSPGPGLGAGPWAGGGEPYDTWSYDMYGDVCLLDEPLGQDEEEDPLEELEEGQDGGGEDPWVELYHQSDEQHGRQRPSVPQEAPAVGCAVNHSRGCDLRPKQQQWRPEQQQQQLRQWQQQGLGPADPGADWRQQQRQQQRPAKRQRHVDGAATASTSAGCAASICDPFAGAAATASAATADQKAEPAAAPPTAGGDGGGGGAAAGGMSSGPRSAPVQWRAGSEEPTRQTCTLQAAGVLPAVSLGGACGGGAGGGGSTWSCRVCTYAHNRRQLLRCEVCDCVRGSSQPPAPPPGPPPAPGQQQQPQQQRHQQHQQRRQGPHRHDAVSGDAGAAGGGSASRQQDRKQQQQRPLQQLWASVGAASAPPSACSLGGATGTRSGAGRQRGQQGSGGGGLQQQQQGACPECGAEVAAGQWTEHQDWHLAVRLSREGIA